MLGWNYWYVVSRFDAAVTIRVVISVDTGLVKQRCENFMTHGTFFFLKDLKTWVASGILFQSKLFIKYWRSVFSSKDGMFPLLHMNFKFGILFRLLRDAQPVFTNNPSLFDYSIWKKEERGMIDDSKIFLYNMINPILKQSVRFKNIPFQLKETCFM